MCTTEYTALLRSLNTEQRKFFDHVLFWFSTSHEPMYQFCTSGAGCGKTYLLKAIYQGLIRLFSSQIGQNPEAPTVLLLSFTGKASFNIGGMTIHSAFQIPVNQSLKHYKPLQPNDLNSLATKLEHIKVLIIDECSMVSNIILHWINHRMQEIFSSNKAFGGKSVFCFGDLYQLPPVHYGQIFADRHTTDTMEIFAENLWQTYFTMYELHTVMRQKDDAQFAHLLNRLREGYHNHDDLNALKSRVVATDSDRHPQNAPHLFDSNAKIDHFNQYIYNEITAHKCVVEAHDIVPGSASAKLKQKIKGCIPEKPQKTKGVLTKLKLAEGLRYELTHNVDGPDGLVNGAAGKLMKLDYRVVNSPRPSIAWI